jgi:hypothetical protein
MAEEAVTEEESFIIEEPKPEPIDGEVALSVFAPTPPVVQSSLSANPAPEMVIAGMGKDVSFDGLKVRAAAEEEDRKTRALTSAVFAGKHKPKDFRSMAEEILNAPIAKHTPGEAAALSILRGNPGKTEFAKDIDIDNGKNILTNSIVENLEHKGSYKSLMKTPNKAAAVAAMQITENDPVLRAKLEREHDLEDMTYDNFWEFINPFGGEKDDGLDVEVWDLITSVVSGDADWEAFDEQMESNYGKSWQYRVGGFLAKEMGIDAALLVLASTGIGAPLAAALKFGKESVRATKIAAAANRAIFIGAGGGAAQAVQNVSIGRDANLGMEVALRGGFAVGGELVGAGIGIAIKASKGSYRKTAINEAAVNRKTKPIGDRKLSKIFNGQQFDTSAISAIAKARLTGSVDNYESVIRDTATTVLQKDKATIELREGLAALTGKDIDDLAQLDVDLILSDATLMRDMFAIEKYAAFANQDNYSRAMSHHILGSTIGHLETFTQQFDMRFTDLLLQLRHTDANINLSNIGMLDDAMKFLKVSEPSRIAKQSGSNSLTANDFSNKLQAGFKYMYKDALGRLSKEEKSVVAEILQRGNSEHRVYDLINVAPDGMAAQLSPRIIEAYNKTRLTMDLGYEILDASKTAFFKDKVKLINGKHYQLGGKAPKDTSKLAAREFNPQDLSSVGGKAKAIPKALWAKTNDITTIVPYRNGHVPRTYAAHNYSVMVYNPTTGTVTREALFDSIKQAEEHIIARAKAGDKDEIVFRLFNNGDTGLGGFSAGNRDMQKLSSISTGQRSHLDELLRANNVGETERKFIIEGLGKPKAPKAKVKNLKGHAQARTELGTAVTEADKQLRIDLAAAKAKKTKAGEREAASIRKKIRSEVERSAQPTEASILEYLGSVSRQSGDDNFRKLIDRDFGQRYKHILAEGTSWGNVAFNKGLRGEELALAKEAKAYARWVNRVVTRTTNLERRWDIGVTNVANRFAASAAAGNKSAKMSSWVIDHLPIMSSEVTAALRFTAAFPKLLSGNVAQLFVQGSQSMASIGAGMFRHPFTTSKALWDVAFLGPIDSMVKSGISIPKAIKNSSAYETYLDLVRSGYSADLTITDTMFALSKHLDPSPGRQLWEATKKVGAAPFRAGEALNRAVAFSVAHGMLKADIKAYAKALAKGTADDKTMAKLQKFSRGFDGEVLKVSDIGSHSFREAVVDRAAVTALNMAKAGELEAMSGFGSVMWQFRQVLPKTISIFDSTKLTGMEKIGALGAMTSMWGTSAIVLAPDIIGAVDWIGEKYSGKPADTMMATDLARLSAETIAGGLDSWLDPEDTKRFLKYGLITTLTDGDVNFTNRVALGSFIGDMLAVQEMKDVIVSFAVLWDFVDASKKLGVVTALNPLSYLAVLYDMGARGKTFQEAFAVQYADTDIGKLAMNHTSLGAATLSTMRNYGKVFAQLGSISRVTDAVNQDIVAPQVKAINPYSPTYYMTSNLKATNVERSKLNDWMLVFGISPGQLVEDSSKRGIEIKYQNAAKNYSKSLEEKMRAALSNEAAQLRIMEEYRDALIEYQKLATRLGIDPKVAHDGFSTASKKLINIILELNSGNAIRNGKLTRIGVEQ